MARSTLPLFPTDDGWPYPDSDGAKRSMLVATEMEDPVDLDDLELRADSHVYDGLTDMERTALFMHFGMRCAPVGMKELGPALGCTRAEARAALGAAIAKMRTRLTET